MNYRIVEEKAFKVVGKDVIIKKDAFTEIPAFVEEIWKNGTTGRMIAARNRFVKFGSPLEESYSSNCWLPYWRPFSIEENLPLQTTWRSGKADGSDSD